MRKSMKLLLATRNSNKVHEIREKLGTDSNFEILSLEDFPDAPETVEDGTTFAENALKKARTISEYTGLPVLADDSGLAVDALDGRPGVYSARYGGKGISDTERNMKLLDEMKDIVVGRTAHFICVIAIVFPDRSEYTAEGRCSGEIITEMRGTNGFGYDPIFFLHEFNKTMAQLPLETKNRISHRARALDRAAEILGKVSE